MLLNQTTEETRAIVAQTMIISGRFSVEQISETSGISIEVVENLKLKYPRTGSAFFYQDNSDVHRK